MSKNSPLPPWAAFGNIVRWLVNGNVKFIRFILGASVGALLWAGCASQPQGGLKRLRQPEPVDLTKRYPDTNPELRTGHDLLNWSVVEMPKPRPQLRVPHEMQ